MNDNSPPYQGGDVAAKRTLGWLRALNDSR